MQKCSEESKGKTGKFFDLIIYYKLYRYNPENLSALEQYVDAQVAEDTYDLEANLAILKLYQFNPTCFKTEYVVSILLKALANLPHTDFILCKCLIDPQLVSFDHM